MRDERPILVEGRACRPLMDRIFALRHEVFVVEQRVPVELEIDELDASALHIAALRPEAADSLEVIGTLRVVREGDHAKIGRVAVRKDARHAGLGTRLLERAIAFAAERGIVDVYLDAQVGAVALYERLGFVAEGDIFDDAGIDHIRMRKPLRQEAWDTIRARLSEAYFPYYDDEGQFCWDRRAVRSIIRLNAAALSNADRLMAQIPTSFTFAEDRSVERVIELLGREEYHKASWVRDEVVAVYRLLHSRGCLRTIEALCDDGLAGAVLGIDLHPVFIIETLLTVRSDSSKAALCWAVKRYATRGYAYFDVQRPHPANHPCHRLGEETMAIDEYLALLHAALGVDTRQAVDSR